MVEFMLVVHSKKILSGFRTSFTMQIRYDVRKNCVRVPELGGGRVLELLCNVISMGADRDRQNAAENGRCPG